MKFGGLRVDTQEVQGPFCKVAGIKESLDLIYNRKFHGPSPRCGGPWAAPVHGGPRTGPRWWLTEGRLEWRPRAWNLTTVEEEGGGNGSEPHRLEEGVAEGRKWSSIGGNNAWVRRQEKRGGERPGEARGWCSPFIGAGEGHAGARKGEMASGNGLNAIEGGAD
jgi:hypothetical protein